MKASENIPVQLTIAWSKCYITGGFLDKTQKPSVIIPVLESN